MLNKIKHKSAIIRYQAIDEEIRRIGNTTFERIKDAVEAALYAVNNKKETISVRQLRKDLSFMKEGLNAPIEIKQEGRNRYYVYSDDFTLERIKTKDLIRLKLVAKSFERFQGIEELKWLSELNEFIEENSSIKTIKPIISFDDKFDYEGANYVVSIYEAIINQNVLEISYKHFKTEEIEKYTVHPQFLKQYNSRWFLFAKNEKLDFSFSQYALDRILKIEPGRGQYITLPINWEEDYFSNRIGVSSRLNEEIQKVELSFDLNQLNYIKTKPIHQTQTPIKLGEDNNFFVTIKVVLNYELEQLILGFGEQVSVIQPIELRERVSERLKNAVRKYE